MAMPAVDRRRWTAREVRQLIADNPLQTPRYELVDGELLVTPSPNWPHQRAVGLLWAALEEYLKRNPVGSVAPSPFDVELEPELIVQPDVFVVPMHEVRRLRTEMPAHDLLVAAEVLSPSSGRHDRVTKRRPYQRHVPQYWIIDLDARLVERWTPPDERPEVLTERLTWHPTGAAEPFVLDLHRYFAQIFNEE
jgi:Uma2 family endonuclease